MAGPSAEGNAPDYWRAGPSGAIPNERFCHFRDEHDDFEDDLVLVACQHSHANYPVTNDVALANQAPIEAKTLVEMADLPRTGRALGTPTTRDSTGSTD
ncbi:MAG: hypothetical protein IKF14_01665 [Atopobiaceae bacterium]|nr:hypothetical protein [Atopobiaceae bacterium]